MTLSRSFPVSSGFPNAVDLRRLDSGLVAREGVFPDPITTAAAGIAVGTTAWNVQARPFVAAVKRGGAPYSLSYGVARLANSAQVNAWEIQPAPASGSRIDLLWIRATDPGEGESTTGSDGPGGAARAVPVFGVTAGTPSGTPATPALPAGALLIATVTTPSSAASIAGSTIVQSYAFAHLVGGVAYYRTAAALLDDTSNKVAGQRGVALDTGVGYEWSGSAWVIPPLGLREVVQFTSNGTFTKASYPWLRAIRVRAQGGGGGGGGCAAAASGQASAGSGGGGGTYTESFIDDIAGLAASVAITIGAGGAGGAEGANNGTNGGQTSFGAIVTAPGGRGGEGGASTGNGFQRPGGLSATAGVGDFTITGGAGFPSSQFGAAAGGGNGGVSFLGAGGRGGATAAGSTSVAGETGNGYGGGGGGAGANANAVARPGGAGTSGVLIVELYA